MFPLWRWLGRRQAQAKLRRLGVLEDSAALPIAVPWPKHTKDCPNCGQPNEGHPTFCGDSDV